MRIDAENGHRRVTRTRLRIIVKETRGYLVVYLRAPSGTVKYGRGPLKVSGARAEHETVLGYATWAGSGGGGGGDAKDGSTPDQMYDDLPVLWL